VHPRVSVVIVNYRSAEHTLAAIDGLHEMDWPEDLLEIVVVDNDSRDGSVDVIRRREPDVVLVESSTNLGFAAGCNLGVEHASGDYVALLNPDARPHRDWIRAAIDVLQHQPTVGCVASKVLDWDGVNLDYGSVGMSFDGQAYKYHAGQPDTGGFEEQADVLFPTGSAMVMPTHLFRTMGGFDESYFMFFEDVDLGWRLWLRGHRVRYVPTSLTYHRHHVTLEKYGSWLERYLLSRNALYTIYKNYGDRNLEKLLAPAILLTIRRGTALGDVDRHALDLGAGATVDDEPGMQVPKQTMATVLAVDSFMENLPTLAEKRREIQATRVRGDAEIVRLFRTPFLANIPLVEYRKAVDDLVEIFALEAELSERRRVVIATADTLTPRMAGPAIRAWNMAKVLGKEHDVKLVTKSFCDVWHADFECRGDVTPDDWPELESWADVIIFQGFLLHEVPMLVGSSKVIVVDLYDPFHLEQLELSRHDPFDRRVLEVGESVRVLNQQIRRGDFFLAASEKQRDFWLGQLSAMQRVNPYVYDRDESLHRLLDVVPFGVPDEPPERTGAGIRGVVPGIGSDDKVLIWGGGIYNWFDPLTLIRAVDKLRHRVPNVRLYFMGTKHPNPDVPEMRVAWEARQIAIDLGLLDTHVFFNEGWVPYEDRQNHLLDADVGVTTHLDHVETEFSFRTRVLDYFWTSLPVVTTAGDPLAALVQSRGLGLTVPAEDVDALEEALHRMLTDEQFVAECRKNVDEIAEEYRWSHVLEPLAEFCRHAARAPDAFTLQVPLREGPAAGFGQFLRTLPLPILVERVVAKLRRVLAVHREGGPTLVVRRSASWGRRKLAERRA
jgi:GT2 family glycosyltransferase/glycosyltransferase involved in cell wall biosynthesis